MQVHEQADHPFPDTFGYSAPTGMISSFGIRLKTVIRLPKPFGDCVISGKTDKYIYAGNYSTEGCFRSCFQHQKVERCRCGDPRFPIPDGSIYCKADDRDASKFFIFASTGMQSTSLSFEWTSLKMKWNHLSLKLTPLNPYRIPRDI